MNQDRYARPALAGLLLIHILAHIDRDEGGVIDRDGLLVLWGDQPVPAVGVAGQQAGEGAHHRRAADRGAHVEPAAIGGDAHLAVEDLRWRPAFQRRQAARGDQRGYLGEGQPGKFWRRFIGHGGLRISLAAPGAKHAFFRQNSRRGPACQQALRLKRAGQIPAAGRRRRKAPEAPVIIRIADHHLRQRRLW